jgi:alpha-glucosidase (family GH31 glycosyl hydrolase)
MIESKQDSEQLIFHSVGGNIHFLIVLGEYDPEATLELYHEYIGKSHIPPFWSLGYHQSRWGYKSLL